MVSWPNLSQVVAALAGDTPTTTAAAASMTVTRAA
jgi:hypothetical protein